MSKEEYIRIITQVVESPRSDIQKIHRLEEAFNMYVRDSIQPQGIDKDRLIEEMDKLKLNKLMDIRAYSVMSHTLELVKDIVNQQHTTDVPDTNDGKIQQPTSDGWIPVSERLPDIREAVLVSDKLGFVRIGHYNGELFFIPSECMFTNNITAWCPLPHPYKESE